MPTAHSQSPATGAGERFEPAARELAALGREFYARGWAPGTAGNLSMVIERSPLRLAITSSGRDKSTLAPDQIVAIDEQGALTAGQGRPSAEALLHVAIVRARGEQAGAVLHTHSVWNTLLSELGASEGGIAIQDYEVLAGLDGVTSHEAREWLPIVENARDWREPAGAVEALLASQPGAHGVLIRRHGLYTWGRDLASARRHVEIFEFLFEVLGRARQMGPAWRS